MTMRHVDVYVEVDEGDVKTAALKLDLMFANNQVHRSDTVLIARAMLEAVAERYGDTLTPPLTGQ